MAAYPPLFPPLAIQDLIPAGREETMNRKCFTSAISAALALLLSATAMVSAEEKEDIVIGGSMPLTGPFAFAGIQFNRGLRDYMEWLNEQGGIEGRQVRYVSEDTGYEPDQSVAVFRRITSREDVNFYFGDSTAFHQTINRELDRRDIMMTGASFASELNDTERYPMQFMHGPDYSEQVAILLRHIAAEDPGARVAFIHSDTEFGRDPISAGRETAEELGLEMAATIVTPPGAADISSAALELRRARPDYAIFHGYILAPIPDFIRRARQMGMDTRFMGTYYSMDQSIIDEMGDAADGFMGVMPYRYFYDEEAGESELMQAIRDRNDEYQTIYYTQAWVAGSMMAQIARETLARGESLKGTQMRATMEELEEVDTGGAIGVPVRFRGNSLPVGRIYRADVDAGRMIPVSDWIELD